ncbi:hypothetical protein [Faecalibacter sp. LW9]|uniref:hypothetical protein n=1 Tax=Faecalibacter sp. LW9 TaxID=3103144 RepID=UPI002AFFBEFF|nr:hypothetical protein [Faecalibacter sp. LW9]
MSHKPITTAIARKANAGQEKFLSELQSLLSYSEPKDVINTIDSVYLDWLGSNYADDNTYRTDATNVFRYIINMIKEFDKQPEVAAQIFKNLKSKENELSK